MLNLPQDHTLNVPLPRPTQYVYRGMKSTKIPTTVPISVRWTDEDHRFVDQQANVLGVTFSEFVRWVAYHAALRVQELEHVASFKLSPVKEKMEDIDLSDWD